MAELYTVNYKINVDSASALASLQKFQESTATLTRISTQIEGLTQRLGRLNSAFVAVAKNQINVTVNTQDAENKLIRLRSLLRELTVLSKKGITLTPPAVSSTKMVPGSAFAMAHDVEMLRNLITTAQSEINSLNKASIKPQAHVEKSQKRLTQLANTLRSIQSMSNIKITASGPNYKQNTKTTTVVNGQNTTTTTTTFLGTDGGGGNKGSGNKGGGGNKGSGTTPAKPAPPAFPVQKPGKSTYLYPTTRQVIGPTYAGTGTTVGGEMIKGMGMAYGISSLMSGITSIFRDATEYENISQTTKNILGVNDRGSNFEGRFNSLNQLMRQVGVDTKFTAPEVASAGKFLAMAGMDIDAIRGAIKPITNMALIGDTDLGETADVVTNIMTSFEIAPNLVGHAADVLTATATNTNTTLMTLAESFKYAGTLAHQTGLSIEETAAMFGVLGNAGRQGSQAGTDIRMMLMNIMNPTKKQKEAWKEVGISAWDKKGNLREFVDILSDLNKKSSEYSSDQFSKLIMRMFRITATSGALALIHGSDKVREVMSKNQQSSGISEKLGLAKQNTIAGLWAQMTSAFTESGIQGFESLQGVIRNFLKETIALMKSDEFANTLKDGMKLFIYMGHAFKDFLQDISDFMNYFGVSTKEWIMFAIKWQLYINMGVGTLKSAWSMLLAIRGVLMGSWLSSFVGKCMRAAVVVRHYYRTLVASSFITSLKGTKLAVMFGALSKSFGKVTSGIKRLVVKLHLLKAASTASAATAAATTAASTAAGSAAGSAVGSAAAGAGAAAAGAAAAKKAGWITRIFGGGAGPLRVIWNLIKVIGGALSGWGIALAAVAAAGSGIWYFLSKSNEKTEEVKKLTDDWVRSYRNLGISKMKVSEGDNLMIAQSRIMGSLILSEQEKIRESIKLYRQLYKEKMNANKPPKQSGSSFVETEFGKKYVPKIQKADDLRGKYEAFAGFIKEMGDFQDDGHGNSYLMVSGSKVPFHRKPGSREKLNKEQANTLVAAMIASDAEHPWIRDVEQATINAIPRALDYNNLNDLYIGLQQQYSSIKKNYSLEKLSPEELWKLPEEVLITHPVIADILNKRAKAAINARTKDWANALAMREGGRDPRYAVLKFMHAYLGDVFNFEQYGVVGSEKWTNTLIGWQKNKGDATHSFKNAQEAAFYITSAYDQLLKLYDMLPRGEYKRLLAPYINETAFKKALVPGIALNSSTFAAPTKENQVTHIDGKKFVSKKDQNGLLQWYDTSGTIFTPSSTSNIGTFTDTDTITNLKTAPDEDDYKSKYGSVNAAPKQVIVRIDNFMNVDSIDLANPDKKAIVDIVKSEALPAFVDFMADVSDSIVNT